MALSADSHFLYLRWFNVSAAGDEVSGFEVNSDGSLTPVNTVSGIPNGAQGLAAR
jgi:hypothetical protein